MALEKTFGMLCERIERLETPLNELVKLTGEFGPKRRVVHLVPSFYDQIIEVDALRAETLAAAMEATRSAGRPLDLQAVRRALTECHEAFNKLLKKFWQEVMSFGQVEELAELGRERGSQWSKWTTTIQAWIKDCVDGFLQVNEMLVICWQEMTERLGIATVSVQNTTIGQQISVPENEAAGAKDFVARGIT
jgi:hypothetical protein